MSLARNSLIASACIFLCRMTGMVREAVYNGLFGLGGPLDAFNTAFRLPNLLRDLFAEGALSQAYTSVASKVKKADGDSVLWELTSKVATQLSSMMVAIVTLGIVFAGPLMGSLYQDAFIHKRVIEDASAHGYERILVLEDDAIPSKYFEATEKASDDVLSRYLRMNTSWGLCYLGYNARLERGVRKLNMGSDLLYPENNVELWKVPGALTLHAVIVSRRAFGTILEALPDESEVWSWIARYRAVDTWIKNFFTLKSGLDVLVMAPQIVIQTESMSDILNRMSTNFVKDLTARPKEVSPVMYWLAEWGPGLFRRLLSDLGRFGKFIRYSRRGFPGKKK